MSDEIVHLQLVEEWECDSLDFSVFEAQLVAPQQLADELAVDLIELVQIAFTFNMKSIERNEKELTIELSGIEKERVLFET